jgi:hypothetical protein
MKLYRAKVNAIAHDVIDLLVQEGDIELRPENRAEAERDLVAIMEEFLRRDNEFRDRIRDHMSARSIPFDQYNQVRKQLAEQMGHPSNDEIERFLGRQFCENLMISPFIEEVFGADDTMRRKIIGAILKHDVDERAIREEAVGKIRNVKEGTVEYEIALQNAMRDVKKRRGLLEDRGRER